jgi:hypothetical protein
MVTKAYGAYAGDKPLEPIDMTLDFLPFVNGS